MRMTSAEHHTSRLRITFFCYCDSEDTNSNIILNIHEALHSASPELHLTLYEFESASDFEWAMSNIAPHMYNTVTSQKVNTRNNNAQIQVAVRK